jgi:8-oxo-dGTP pyrophosphatase MutT (NUDIX family)
MEATAARGGVTPEVRAAGGVVVRDGDVLVVHRPRYDDWTFPKGKAENDESDEDCALREVHEETGLRCALEDEIAATHYVDAKGRSKRVRWWHMRQLADDGFTPNDEVDELRWVDRDTAAELLTYPRDRALLL